MKLKPHKPIREKYSPTPSAAEKRHHLRVMGQGCMVCQAEAIAHHILQKSPYKRWRRDHRQVVPLCDAHHRELHAHGDEREWENGYQLELANHARMLELASVYEGIL